MMALHHQPAGPYLSTLFHGIAELGPAHDRPVSGVCMDSRKARRGDLFLACEGTRTSGALFIDDAVRAGAVAVAVEAPGRGGIGRLPVPVIPVADLGRKAGIIAARFFGDPSRDLRVIGVTGTNGKTSVAHYIAAALDAEGTGRAGIIGTLGYGPAGSLAAGLLTTPDAVTLQKLFAGMRDQGIATVVMEVSSHALHQGRTAGTRFELAVFTNLTREHLDFHGDMQAYGDAKRLLFDSPGLRHAVINLDDEFGRRLRADLSSKLPITGYRLVEEFGRAGGDEQEVRAVLRANEIGRLALEVRSPWGSGRLQCALTGRFNAYNVLAALAGLCLVDLPFSRAVTQLQQVAPVPGRMECFHRAGAPRVIVDYAHTPDALAQALAALKDQCGGELVCVFGCGGDRDRGKRPEMGAVAQATADRVYLTSDNPRSEAPERIIREIREGMRGSVNVSTQPDRAMAITEAIRNARDGDVVLIAGKGHESYQEIAGTRYPFSDRQLVRKLLEEWS